MAAGRYHVIVTTASGANLDGPSVEVLPVGSFFRSFLGISQGRFDFGTDHLVQRHLARMPDGALAATYSGRTVDNDVRLTFQMSHDGGRTWAVAAPFPISNPDFSEVFAASFSVAAGQGSQMNVVYVQWPSYRQTFAAYNYAGGDLIGLAPKMPVFFSDQPMYAGPSVIDSANRIWVAYALGKDIFSSYSTDGGLTWTQTPKINQGAATPPALVLLNGAPFVVYSDNAALAYSTWSGAQWNSPQTLPGPVTGVADNLSVAATADGRVHVAAAAPSGVQYLAFDGTSWASAIPLEPGSSMPSITTDGNDLWCFYVTTSKNIAYRRWRHDNSAWDAAVAVTNDSLGHSRPATLPVNPDGSVPLIWTVGSAAPYEIHSALIGIQTAGALALDTQAFATPRLVAGKQANLAVSAVGGQPPYSYAWSAPVGSALSNAASASPAATFSHAGSYRLPVTVRDSAGASSAAYVDLAVAPLPTALSVVPPAGPLAVNAPYSFGSNVTDQFGDRMALGPVPAWSVTAGKGAIDANGNFVAQQAGDVTVTATLPGGASASATVTVQPASALPPVISNITRSAITTDSATIQWVTNTPSDSRVEYGLDTSYGSSMSDPTMATTHKIVLNGLSAGRIYHFRVHSANAAGMETVSVDLTFAAARPR
jgi:hypothetical protein